MKDIKDKNVWSIKIYDFKTDKTFYVKEGNILLFTDNKHEKILIDNFLGSSKLNDTYNSVLNYVSRTGKNWEVLAFKV